MGQDSSKVIQDHPVRLVPTTPIVNKAELQSKWWSQQVSGAAPAPACLDGYGRQYASLFERHCGEYRKEHQRCMRKGKFDPLDMKTWYPACGEAYEIETACAVSLLKHVDLRCRQQLDNAAEAVSHGQATQRLPKQLESVGQCMGQLGADKGMKLNLDTAQAKERFRLSKQLLVR